MGATRSDVRWLVLRAGGRLVAIGALIGIAASGALTQILTTQVFLVPLLDPIAMIAAALLLAVVGVLTCLIPTWRATKVDPMLALRAE